MSWNINCIRFATLSSAHADMVQSKNLWVKGTVDLGFPFHCPVAWRCELRGISDRWRHFDRFAANDQKSATWRQPTVAWYIYIYIFFCCWSLFGYCSRKNVEKPALVKPNKYSASWVYSHQGLPCHSSGINLMGKLTQSKAVRTAYSPSRPMHGLLRPR